MAGPNGRAPLTRAQTIRAARAAAQAAREVDFPLTATGGVARVRRLDMMELVALDSLPAFAQKIVNDMLEAGMAASGDQTDPTAWLRTLGGPLQGMRHQQALADVFCLAGFIDPKLVPTDADITDPDHELAVADIELADRMAYWSWCNGITEADALAPVFPQPAAAPLVGSLSEPVRIDPVDVPLRPTADLRR